MGADPNHGATWPRFVAVADHALLVEFGAEIDDAAAESVLALDTALAADPVDGSIEVVPAYVSLLVDFDPVTTDHDAVERAVRERLQAAGRVAPNPTVRHVEVCYDDAFGPDLEAVAAACGLSIEATIAAHVGGDYRVAMYGFAPGCAYLAGVPETIRVPRKPAPIRGVAAGSVIIAGPQCMVTTIDTPTGWSIIGRSPTPILLDDPDRPFLFDVGDRVEFTPIDRATFDGRRRDRAADRRPGVDRQSTGRS